MKDRDFDWCLKRALWYLGRYLCSEKRLRDYLERKGCSEFSEEIIKRLSNSKVLDEVSALNYFLERYSVKYGKDMVRQKLISKGFRKEFIEEAIAGISDEEERKLALRIAKARLEKLPESMEIREKRERIFRHLIYRGISRQTAYEVVRRIVGTEINRDE
jgi:SOS response regulatory protein OraA/RecX